MNLETIKFCFSDSRILRKRPGIPNVKLHTGLVKFESPLTLEHTAHISQERKKALNLFFYKTPEFKCNYLMNHNKPKFNDLAGLSKLQELYYNTQLSNEFIDIYYNSHKNLLLLRQDFISNYINQIPFDLQHKLIRAISKSFREIRFYGFKLFLTLDNYYLKFLEFLSKQKKIEYLAIGLQFSQLNHPENYQCFIESLKKFDCIIDLQLSSKDIIEEIVPHLYNLKNLKALRLTFKNDEENCFSKEEDFDEIESNNLCKRNIILICHFIALNRQLIDLRIWIFNIKIDNEISESLGAALKRLNKLKNLSIFGDSIISIAARTLINIIANIQTLETLDFAISSATESENQSIETLANWNNHITSINIINPQLFSGIGQTDFLFYIPSIVMSIKGIQHFKLSINIEEMVSGLEEGFILNVLQNILGLNQLRTLYLTIYETPSSLLNFFDRLCELKVLETINLVFHSICFDHLENLAISLRQIETITDIFIEFATLKQRLKSHTVMNFFNILACNDQTTLVPFMKKLEKLSISLKSYKYAQFTGENKDEETNIIINSGWFSNFPKLTCLELRFASLRMDSLSLKSFLRKNLNIRKMSKFCIDLLQCECIPSFEEEDRSIISNKCKIIKKDNKEYLIFFPRKYMIL